MRLSNYARPVLPINTPLSPCLPRGGTALSEQPRSVFTIRVYHNISCEPPHNPRNIKPSPPPPAANQPTTNQPTTLTMSSFFLSKALESEVSLPSTVASGVPSRTSLSRCNSYDRDRQLLRKKRQWQRRRDSSVSSFGRFDSGVEDNNMYETEEPTSIEVCIPA